MALFLARSALCIGAVAWAASGAGVGPLGDALKRGARAAAGDAGRACLASAPCLDAAAAAVGGTAAFPAATPTALPAPALAAAMPTAGAAPRPSGAAKGRPPPPRR